MLNKFGKNSQPEKLDRILNAVQIRRKARLDKILKFAQSKDSITENEIIKLFHVSKTTASSYLFELVRWSKLKRVGDENKYKLGSK